MSIKHKSGNFIRDQRVSGRIILKWFLWKKGCWGVDWIHLAKGTVQWWAVVNA